MGQALSGAGGHTACPLPLGSRGGGLSGPQRSPEVGADRRDRLWLHIWRINPAGGPGSHLERSYLSGSGREPMVRKEVRGDEVTARRGTARKGCGQVAGRIYKTPSSTTLEAAYRDSADLTPSFTAPAAWPRLTEKDSGVRL